jgi:hypothetical protein
VIARLADIYRQQGRWDESEALYRRALNILGKAWGPENSQLLSRFSNPTKRSCEHARNTPRPRVSRCAARRFALSRRCGNRTQIRNGRS